MLNNYSECSKYKQPTHKFGYMYPCGHFTFYTCSKNLIRGSIFKSRGNNIVTDGFRHCRYNLVCVIVRRRHWREELIASKVTRSGKWEKCSLGFEREAKRVKSAQKLRMSENQELKEFRLF